MNFVSLFFMIQAQHASGTQFSLSIIIVKYDKQVENEGDETICITEQSNRQSVTTGLYSTPALCQVLEGYKNIIILCCRKSCCVFQDAQQPPWPLFRGVERKATFPKSVIGNQKIETKIKGNFMEEVGYEQNLDRCWQVKLKRLMTKRLLSFA